MEVYQLNRPIAKNPQSSDPCIQEKNLFPANIVIKSLERLEIRIGMRTFIARKSNFLAIIVIKYLIAIPIEADMKGFIPRKDHILANIAIKDSIH